jgi:acyl carrier protein
VESSWPWSASPNSLPAMVESGMNMKIVTETTEIREQLRRYIAENLLFSDKRFPFEDDASFLKNGVVDSTGVMELVAYVETQFGVIVGPKEVIPDNFDSIKSLADYIKRKTGGN